MSGLRCPNCGNETDFDFETIQEGKPDYVTCARCGFNAPETEFETVEEIDAEDEEEDYSEGPPSIRQQAIGMNREQTINLLISSLDSLNRRIDKLEKELKLHVNYH